MVLVSTAYEDVLDTKMNIKSRYESLRRSHKLIIVTSAVILMPHVTVQRANVYARDRALNWMTVVRTKRILVDFNLVVILLNR